MSRMNVQLIFDILYTSEISERFVLFVKLLSILSVDLDNLKLNLIDNCSERKRLNHLNPNKGVSVYSAKVHN